MKSTYKYPTKYLFLNTFKVQNIKHLNMKNIKDSRRLYRRACLTQTKTTMNRSKGMNSRTY